MRKLLITTSLALILAACGGGSDESKSTTLDAAKEKAGEISEATKETATDLADSAEEVTADAQDAASEVAEDLADAADDASEKADEVASDMANAADEVMEDAKEAASDLQDAAEAKVEEAKAKIDLSALPAPYNTADLGKGKNVFRQCASCHLVDDSGKHRIGPNLYGVVDRESGTIDGFNYSKAMKEAGIVWTAETIDEYIENPRAYIPGNRMSFAGLRKPEDRVNVVAYLMVEGGKTAD